MEPTTSNAMSSLRSRGQFDGPVNFPTLTTAIASVKAKFVQQFGPILSEITAGPFSGSFNEVIVYTIQFAGGGSAGGGPIQKKIAVRMGKEASFKKMETGGVSDGDGMMYAMYGTMEDHTSLRAVDAAADTIEFAKIKKDAEKSEQNWVNAHNHKLSPQLYFYGYVVRAPGNDALYLCTISEAMMYDLYHFYVQGPGAASDAIIDNNVRQQLTSLFDRLAKDMHMICFDIKPSNTVINYTSSGNLTVKLIDWDADWCITFDHLKKREIADGTSLAAFTSVIMQVVMAMFFYFYFHNNIFATFFNTAGSVNTILTEHNKSLKVLFCNNNTHFQKMARHYFQSGLQIPSSCEELWDEMYKRVFYKNPAAFAAGGGGGVVTGGGRSKYKRRRRKTRRKRRRSRRRTQKKRHKRRRRRRRRTQRRK